MPKSSLMACDITNSVFYNKSKLIINHLSLSYFLTYFLDFDIFLLISDKNQNSTSLLFNSDPPHLIRGQILLFSVKNIWNFFIYIPSLSWFRTLYMYYCYKSLFFILPMYLFLYKCILYTPNILIFPEGIIVIPLPHSIFNFSST